MINKDTIKQIIKQFHKQKSPKIISRNCELPVDSQGLRLLNNLFFKFTFCFFNSFFKSDGFFFI